ncbi:MAG: Ferrichrome-iron receptor precursor, partial [Verrucomicrobiota bacterium]
EIELVGNITKRWRVSANVAKQETVVNGSARLTKKVADAVFANLVKFNLLGIDQGPALPERQTLGARFAGNIGTPLAATVARDGAVSPEQRKWPANFVSTYDLKGFEHPLLNKLSVGGAIRWQGKIAIGAPFLTGEALKKKILETDKRFTSTSQISDNDEVMQTQFPDLAHPFYGPEELAGDVWVGYRRRIFKNVEWRLQLNVRNAWGNGEDIPVTANPDGSIAVIRIPNETRWLLSSTFSF